MTRWQKAGLLASEFIPVAWLFLGVRAFFTHHYILNFIYLTTFLLLPGLSFFLLWRIIRSSKKPFIKWIGCILILILSVCSFFLFFLCTPFTVYECAPDQEALEQYESGIGKSNPLMPEIDSLGQPLQMEYHYYSRHLSICHEECFTLICTYSPGEYTDMLASLETQYTFQTIQLGRKNEAQPLLFTLDNYRFRFLEMDTDRYGLIYPKDMILIGTNDETCEIIWSYFSDIDLDSISSPQNFLETDCGWKYIR